jgi:8-hydroxy-5-deazaflavin:NADPH oxidoreductase
VPPILPPKNGFLLLDQEKFHASFAGVSSAEMIAGLLPSGAHFVKAFGTVSAEHLTDAANRSPDRAVLFYATDDDIADSAAERLISVAGFAPVKAGGLNQAIRIEVFGDLHDLGGLNGKLLTVAEARVLLADGRG